jgi:hypothetical protein
MSLGVVQSPSASHFTQRFLNMENKIARLFYASYAINQYCDTTPQSIQNKDI